MREHLMATENFTEGFMMIRSLANNPFLERDAALSTARKWLAANPPKSLYQETEGATGTLDQEKSHAVSTTARSATGAASVAESEGSSTKTWPVNMDKDSKAKKEQQLRLCSEAGCTVKAHWRRMRATRIEANYEGAGTLEGDRAQLKKDPSKVYGEYYYECVQCVAKKEGVTLKEAERLVKQPRTQKHMDRVKDFKFAMDHAAELFEFVADNPPIADGESLNQDDAEAVERKNKRLKYSVVVKNVKVMRDFFGPMFAALAQKLTDEVNAVRAAKNYKKWVDNADGEVDDALKGMKVDEELENACAVWRAFASFVNQGEMCRAADYCDRWFEKANGEKFSTFYPCRGHTPECGALIPSETWARLHEDPEASGQRWYCNYCKHMWGQGTKYKTKWGVVVEMCCRRIDGTLQYMYCQAPFPQQGIQDAKLMMVEKQFALKDMTAKELLAALPKIVPGSTSLIEEAVVPNVFKFKNMEIKDLPMFDWNQLFNLVKDDKTTAELKAIEEQ
jgi:hypothetical protein